MGVLLLMPVLLLLPSPALVWLETRFENKFDVFYGGGQRYANSEVPFPPRYLQDRYLHSILVYAAYFVTLEEVGVSIFIFTGVIT